MTWEAKPEVEKTCVNIKESFTCTWRKYLNEQKTIETAGYHSANAAISEYMDEAIKVFSTQTQ